MCQKLRQAENQASWVKHLAIVNAKEKFLKEIKGAVPVNSCMIKMPYCWFGEGVSGLDRRTNQPQHSLKPKSKSDPGPVKMKVIQLCPTLCDPMDYTVHGILQARILEWVDFSFSRGSSRPRNWTRVSCIAGRFFTNWAITEAP